MARSRAAGVSSSNGVACIQLGFGLVPGVVQPAAHTGTVHAFPLGSAHGPTLGPMLGRALGPIVEPSTRAVESRSEAALGPTLGPTLGRSRGHIGRRLPSRPNSASVSSERGRLLAAGDGHVPTAAAVDGGSSGASSSASAAAAAAAAAPAAAAGGLAVLSKLKLALGGGAVATLGRLLASSHPPRAAVAVAARALPAATLPASTAHALLPRLLPRFVRAPLAREALGSIALAAWAAAEVLLGL